MTDTLQHLLVRLAIAALRSGHHKMLQPSVGALFGAASSVHLVPRELLERYFASEGCGVSLSDLEGEFADLDREMAARYRVNLGMPAPEQLPRGILFLLYALVRIRRPSIIVETGVAKGRSTFFMLNALARNGSGRLCSVDVRAGVGALLNDRERAVWHLEILDARDRRAHFETFLRRIGPLDFFLHDSDHSYQWQSYEYRVAVEQVRPGGLVASDDVDTSFAFLDFCRTAGMAPIFLIDQGQVFGLASVPAARQLQSTGVSEK